MRALSSGPVNSACVRCAIVVNTLVCNIRATFQRSAAGGHIQEEIGVEVTSHGIAGESNQQGTRCKTPEL